MNPLKALIDAITNPRIIKEIVYLLLAMPLGIAYFVILVTGFSLGMSLLILGVGLLILAGLLALSRVGGWIEALLARHLLDAAIEPSLDLQYDHSSTFIANVGRILTDGKAIRSLVFLGLKFPLGLLTFIFTVIAITIPLGLISAPFTYNTGLDMQVGNNVVNTPVEAFFTMLLGIILLPLALAALKGMATAWRKFAEAMLDTEYGTEKQKRKQKRDVSHLMDDYDEEPADENDYEEIAAGLRQLINS